MTLRSLLLATSLLLPASALATSGGPDSYGYTWADSSSGGAAYDYVFAPDVLSLSSDDGSAEVTLPFTFDFYGYSVSELLVHANGALSMFDWSGSLGASNTCPLGDSGRLLIAPFWDDLAPVTTGTVYVGSTGNAPNRVYIVEWYGVGHELTTGDVTFEVKLFEADNHIEFHYGDVTLGSSSYSNGESAAVGLNVTDDEFEFGCNDGGLGSSYAISWYPPVIEDCIDEDEDGWCSNEECDDWDDAIHPGAAEVCNALDDDCDGQLDEGFDGDNDGWSSCGGDCDNSDSSTYPGAPETCDFDDNDCDGLTDEGFDSDGDGFSSCDGDCDDDDEDINPDEWDVPGDGIDQDCDGEDSPGGDDDDSTPEGDDDDDDATADDDDATADDDDDATADDDDDDATADDDDSTPEGDDDDDATADDDDSAADDDDSAADDDDNGGGGGGGGRRGGCDQAGSDGASPLLALGLLGLGLVNRRREQR